MFVMCCCFWCFFFFSSRRRHTRCALVTGVQTCALPIFVGEGAEWIVADTVNAYHAVLRLHSEGQVVDEVFADAEFLGDTVGGVDVVDLVPLHGVQAASAVLAWGFQFPGSRSSLCRIGCVAMRASASASQAWGTTSVRPAVAIRLYMTAARWPPRSEPQNSQDFRPNAMPRRARSAALLERQTRPSSRNRVKAVQRRCT